MKNFCRFLLINSCLKYKIREFFTSHCCFFFFIPNRVDFFHKNRHSYGMKIEKELEQVLNEQITHEFEAAYTYLGLSTALNDAGFPGFSHWMRKQYEEELTHAMKSIDYIQERGGSVKFQSFECPNFILKCPC